MSRNDAARFSQQPATNIRRSKFSRNADYSCTMNAGVLIPFYADDGVLPSDTFDIDVSALCRQLSPLKHPVIDNAYLDVYFFGVPWRLVWEHAEEFHGATDKAWNVDATPVTGEGDVDEYYVPKRSVPAGGYKCGSIADYFGIPTYVEDNRRGLNVLKPRAYLKVWNDFFRDGNLMDEAKLNIGDDGDDDDAFGTLESAPLPVCKFHDLFTSALPYPQRGDPVSIQSLNGLMPVYTIDGANEYYDGATGLHRLKFKTAGGNGTTAFDTDSVHMVGMRRDANGLYGISAASDGGSGYTAVEASNEVRGTPNWNWLAPVNQVADLSYASSVTVNQLRLALQMQSILEADARGGTRYTSLIKQHFGVISPDARLQRAEYLGGKRISLNTQQVIQQSGVFAENGDALGEVGAMSKTVDGLRAFVKSFTEHTVLIGVMCIRVDQSYQQGLDKSWTKSTRFDYYLPELANIGEMPIKNSEIYWQGTEEDDGNIGFQEPWYEYRFNTSRKVGYLRSNARIITGEQYQQGLPGVPSYTDSQGTERNAVDVYGNPLAGSLDSWHYAPWYSSLPKLSAEWIVEDPNVIDRTLAVTSATSHQFLVQLYFTEIDTRPMPVYSIPGIGTHF